MRTLLGICIGTVIATSAATAQQVPQYQVAGFPITPLQMSVLQPSAKVTEQQRLSAQPQRTMDASRGAVARDSVSTRILPYLPARL
jgi:hypothetical protein